MERADKLVRLKSSHIVVDGKCSNTSQQNLFGILVQLQLLQIKAIKQIGYKNFNLHAVMGYQIYVRLSNIKFTIPIKNECECFLIPISNRKLLFI